MPGPKASGKTLVEVDGQRMTLTNLDKVLYPATGTAKADVIGYYAAGGAGDAAARRRPAVTRKRWPNGVESEPFFQKNVDAADPGLDAGAADRPPVGGHRLPAGRVARGAGLVRSERRAGTARAAVAFR